MLFNFTSNKDYQDMNLVAYDAINSYISKGYHIDVKESIIDHSKDKNCIFKAVLKKEADNSNYKVAIKICGFEDDSNTVCLYSKVETIDNIKLNEETRSFSLRKYDVNKIADSKFKRLSDVVNIVDSDTNSCKDHVKIDSHESADDIYSKIINKQKTDQKNENKVESCVNNANTSASSNMSSNTAKQNYDDEFEDSIVRLIHYLCNELVIRQWC